VAAGRTLASIQRADLFGDRRDQEAARNGGLTMIRGCQGHDSRSENQNGQKVENK
jgi:hypothetical protein